MGSRKDFDNPRQLKYLHRKWGEYVAHSKGRLKQVTADGDWVIVVEEFTKEVIVPLADLLTAPAVVPEPGVQVTFEVYRRDNVYIARNVALPVQDRVDQSKSV